MNFIWILFIPRLSCSYHRRIVTNAPLITPGHSDTWYWFTNFHYSKTHINAPYHRPSLIYILTMNQAWSYKIHSNHRPPHPLLNTEGSCLVGWLNVGGILVKLLPGTYNIVHEIHKCCQLSRPHGNWSVKFTIFLSALWHRLLVSQYKTWWRKSEMSQFGTVHSERRSNSRFEQAK